MSEYAVVNPATGESVKKYPTITDAELRAAIGRADAAHRDVVASRPRSRSARRSSAASANCTPSGASSSASSSSARWASRSSRRSARSTSPPRSTSYYADNADGAARGRADRAARGRRLGVRPPQLARGAARDHAVELPVLPGRPLRRPEPRDRQHDPAQARAAVPRVGRGDASRSSTTPASRRTPTSTSTRRNEQIESVIADPRVQRRLAHRLRARRRGGRRDRRPQPEEGRARARRLGPVHPARHRRPRRHRRDRRRRAPGELGQACNAAKRFIVVDELYDAVPREVHGRADRGRSRGTRRRPTRRSARCPRPWRPSASTTRSSARSTRARPSSPAATATATSSRRPS